MQVGLEVGKCSLVDLKGMGMSKDCHCRQYLGVHLGCHSADTDFDEVLGNKPCGLNGKRKVEVQHDLTWIGSTIIKEVGSNKEPILDGVDNRG